MKISGRLVKPRRGVFGTLIAAPMLYAVFALLASSPAHSQTGCTLLSCQVDITTCHFEQGVGDCCLTCYNYDCPGGVVTTCRQECGAQC